MTCRFGIPEKRGGRPGQIAVPARNLEKRTRSSTSAPRRSRRPVVPRRRPCSASSEGLIARRVPELPCRDAGACHSPRPAPPPPKVAVQPNRTPLAADAAGAWPLGEARVTIRRQRRPEALVCSLQPQPCGAPLRRAAPGRGGRRDAMGPPVELDRPRRRLGNPGAPQRVARRRLRSPQARLESAPRPLVALPTVPRLDLPHSTTPADPAEAAQRQVNDSSRFARAGPRPRAASRPLKVWKKLLEASRRACAGQACVNYEEPQRIRLSSKAPRELAPLNARRRSRPCAVPAADEDAPGVVDPDRLGAAEQRQRTLGLVAAGSMAPTASSTPFSTGRQAVREHPRRVDRGLEVEAVAQDLAGKSAWPATRTGRP